MINTVNTGAGVSDREPDRRPPRREQDPANPALVAEEPPAPAPGSDLRLVIERDAEGAYYVYRLIDRTTGEVVQERRREQMANLAQAPDYRAGTVVSTKA